jgi:hypothetical protein
MDKLFKWQVSMATDVTNQAFSQSGIMRFGITPGPDRFLGTHLGHPHQLITTNDYKPVINQAAPFFTGGFFGDCAIGSQQYPMHNIGICIMPGVSSRNGK